MDEKRFKPMNDGHWTGVIEVVDDGGHYQWVVEPEYSWRTAQLMANELNKNPHLDLDDLTRMVEAG